MRTKKTGLPRITGLTMLIGAVALGLTGCASDGGSPFGVIATEQWVRNYVNEQKAPIEAKVAQVDARVTQVDGRVTQVDGRVTQVAAQTAEARKVADEGVKKADGVNARVSQALANRYKRTLVETVPLHYAPNQFLLLPEHQKILARVLKVLADNPTYTVDLVGYTDASGSKKDNNQLSWRREEVVRRYLTDGAPLLNRISFIGLGEEKADGPKKDAADRHVTIAIYRPAD